MALTSTSSMPSTGSPRVGAVAVVAPYGEAGRHAQEYARRGWKITAVTLPAHALPAQHREGTDLSDYPDVIEHVGGLRRTARRLRERGVSAVIAGSGIGVPLADRLTRALGLAGNDPGTTALRTDRGVQAAALADAGLAAPRVLRTASLAGALRWAESSRLPAYVVAVADSSAAAPPAVCRSAAEISTAWRRLRRAAHHQTGTHDLVIQEYLPGRQYIVHTVSSPASQHAVTGVWAEERTSQHVHTRSDLMASPSLLVRSLYLYAMRVLDALCVETGPARFRMVLTGRGPTLLSARAFAEPPLAAELFELTAGIDHLREAVRASTTGLVRPWVDDQTVSRFVSRVSLIAPREGVLDAQLLRTVTTLPTVRHVVGSLVAGAAVRKTVDRQSSPGELVLSAVSRQAIEEDYRVIRAVERLGLYDGAAL
ncbi:hypothetical protein [Streptomyces sp. DH12]|uniref:hypothetical protein n=1 Tax=Streptomyces sp. DH12 TaxID=2857010 RepID=UPI001E468273|nr:hypothetical protein [Streptomyces sp. DH12]